MAATPSKPESPSNKEVQQSTSDVIVETVKEDPTSAVVAAVDDSTSPATANNEEPSSTTEPLAWYVKMENSPGYVLAKQLLAAGDFEQAMSTLEEAMEEVKALLTSLKVPDAELHESLAPLHYLYGTTLLYSIEESNDTPMTVGQATEQEDEDSNDEGNDGGATMEAAAPVSPENFVEDMEIAWEHLDTARNMVERLLKSPSKEDEKTKLSLDLAQILLREGDLQRMNGRYGDAIQDYTACLELRRQFLPEFDRKIADAQYNLGLSHLSQATEFQKQQEQPPQEESPIPGAASQPALDPAAVVAVSQHHCEKGVQLYVDCSRTICGLIAEHCDVEPKSILDQTYNPDDDVKSKVAGLKTTGLETSTTSATTSAASDKVKGWRQAVAQLVANGSSDEDEKDEDKSTKVYDLCQLLDEIQETIDEAEQSQEAIREASKLKQQAAAAAEKEDGIATSTGFDKPTLTSAAAVPAAAAAQPMMVVKKKKKRPAVEEETEQENKRAKTE